MFQNKGHGSEMKSRGNKTTPSLLERGDGIHNVLFFWCGFASTAALAGGEGPGSGEEHGKGRCINLVKVVKCLAMQSHSCPTTGVSFGMTSLATAANPVAVSHWARVLSHFSV